MRVDRNSAGGRATRGAGCVLIARQCTPALRLQRASDRGGAPPPALRGAAHPGGATDRGALSDPDELGWAGLVSGPRPAASDPGARSRLPPLSSSPPLLGRLLHVPARAAPQRPT